jgi:hypothetical protein
MPRRNPTLIFACGGHELGLGSLPPSHTDRRALCAVRQSDPMQSGRTEQNERRTLQCEFDVRSLEKGEHTLQHLFDSWGKNSFEPKCACVSPLTPSSERGIARCLERGMRRDGGPSKQIARIELFEGRAAISIARIHCFKVGVFHCALKTVMLLTRRKNQRQAEEALGGERWQIARIMECRRARDFARAKRPVLASRH